MTTTEQVQTLGPADPKAPFFAKLYAVLGALLTLASTAGAFGLLNSEQVASIKDLGTQVGLTAGALVSVIAAFRTRKQLANGTFQKAPDPVVVTAAPPMTLDQVTQVRDGLDTVISDAVATAQSGLEQLSGLIPAGPAAEAVSDLVRAVRNSDAAPGR